MSDKPKELEEHSAQIFELGCMERPVYLKEDANAVIAELKQKLQDQCISCPVKMQEDDVVAEKDNEIRRLKRALWLARAERAKEMCKRLLIQGFDPKWEEVERKCLKKAEEYK